VGQDFIEMIFFVDVAAVAKEHLKVMKIKNDHVVIV
jgi:hypothetical protein